jgi:PHS family inorganic phosphate transporter-like MFS transporter
MGIGIGGDYPLSAVISSEFASTKIRGRMMTAVFANQGWGNFSKCLDSISFYLLIHLYPIAAALVAFIITAAFKSSILKEASITDLKSVDYMWRILIGLGCVPGVVALYFRLTIPETPRFTMDIERNIDQATSDIKTVLTNTAAVRNDDLVQRVEAPRASWADFREYFGKLENFKVLFGCAYSWFALDVSTSNVPWLVY